MAKKMVIGALILGICPVGVAQAQDAPSSDRLTIDVSATIAERCGIAADGPTSNSAADLDAATSLEFPFRIDCNTRFRIGVSALNGALLLAGATEKSADGFADRKAYSVGLEVATDGVKMAPEDCDSVDLTGRGTCAFFGQAAGQGLSSGRRTAIDRRGVLAVRWPASDGRSPRRAAGLYSDTLTIVVGAQS